ncbi:MAG: hypothetical protein QOE19_2500 [Actinomycetota bacterium]|nr:hypothetical protein [Actinomycetota bacterium]MDQ1669417.1 hypothetical protein [Actinomycetota bacterium]
MILVLVVAVLALAVAAAAGGESLARLHVRAVRLLVLAAAVQVGTAVLAPHSVSIRAIGLLLAATLVALFLWGNWHLPGIPLVAIGLLLNGVVVCLNQAMPVSVDAAARAGLDRADLRLADDPLHEESGPDTRLSALGDTIPVVLPWRPQVVSPGDVLVASGTGLLLAVGQLRPRRRRPVRAWSAQRAERPSVLVSESTTRGSYS